MTTEQRLAQVFVELADTLVDEFDALDFLSTLTERSVELLHADAAGVILNDLRGKLHVVASTSDEAKVLELFELQNDEGPVSRVLQQRSCGGQRRDIRRALAVAALQRRRRRGRLSVGPRDPAAPAGLGHRRDEPLQCRRRAPLTDEDVALGQALADIATIGLLQERAVRQSGLIAEQLQTALNSRIADRAGQGRAARQCGRRRRTGVPADARLQPQPQPADQGRCPTRDRSRT